jgi:hypothetical protein
VLLEIHARTGFAHAFTHLSEGEARATDLPVSLCAVLLAEACNIGLEPVVHSASAALTRGRLTWVQQNYVRADPLTQANATLVDTQSTIALAQGWGGGEVASADGLRFVVPIRTINAGPNRKYFNADRGVTYDRSYADVESRIKTGIESPWGGKTLCLSHSGYTSWRCCILPD